MGNKWGEPYDGPSLQSERVSRPWHREGEYRLSLADSLSWAVRAESSMRANSENPQDRPQEKRTPKSYRGVPLECSAGSWPAHVWGNYQRLRGGEHLKRLEATVPSVHTGIKITPVLTRWTGKSCNLQGIW